MDLTGIENEAEFFPAGTLSDALQDELVDITARWGRKGQGPDPVARLSKAAEPYLAALRQIRNTAENARRHELRRAATHDLVAALGYDYSRYSIATSLESSSLLPALARVADADGRDAVWLLEAALEGPDDEAVDPLGTCFEANQFPEDEREFAETSLPIETLLADGIFGLQSPPRHVLIFSLSQIVLIDRNKWPARSVLRFDLQEIFSRQDPETLAVMACLVSREARVPDQGTPIADRIEEEAQRNANAVTSSLKATVRDAIEILGQEVLDVTGGKYPSGPRKGVWIEGPELSLECLRFMYRMLFLFYAEANPRLNILDLKDPIYASGYSIEALRELESVRLRTPAEKSGTYLWQSLQRTLTLLYEGNSTVMRLPAVKVSLLDPDSTPILNDVKLRNEAIQKVIRLLSLKQSRSGTARISYAKLGIGQLGAVYETLISFTGVVAKQDLIELKSQKERSSATDQDTDESGEDDQDDFIDPEDNADDEADGASRKDKIDKLAPSYFVPRSRADEFKPEDIVFDGPQARIYPKGSFIYRLAGRDREKSASYYTPEPLARLLVKHALMERCKDIAADEILDLKILEPAMGSAAFLVETTNQLADLYLERKQKEVGRTIPQDRIVVEKQKVRAFIADRNCFGVDLNPVAAELGAISLWLNSLHASEFSPWFGDQLHAGNSLVGARRASYGPVPLNGKKAADLWFNMKPEEIGWRKTLPEGHVWQWLLPAKDMANFDKDKSIKPFAGDAQEQIKAWRKSGFFNKLEAHEVMLLQKLSRVAEALFDQVAEDLAKTREASNDQITLWPDKLMAGNSRLDFHGKEQITARLTGADHAANTLPYKRLKTAMDAWCALWMWPLDKAKLLPSRAEFLQGMAMILEGGFSADGSLAAPSIDEFSDPSPDFFDQLEPDAPAKDLFKAAARRQEALFRETNVEALIETFDWLGVAVQVAARERFVHFDLIFADVMKARGGFDIIVGNPPWAKSSWNEGLVLADIDPLYAGLSASVAREILSEALKKSKGFKRFLGEYVSTRGSMEVTSSEVMNPYAGSGQNNLYRCFIDLSFRLVSPDGNISLIHQDGHLKEDKSYFRVNWYKRIIKHFEFSNKISSKNFAEVLHTKRFSLNVYRGTPSEVQFDQITNAFLASQVDDSYVHDGSGELPLLRNENGSWNTRGHRKRIYKVSKKELEVFKDLLSPDGTPETARLIQMYSSTLMGAITAFARLQTVERVFGGVQIEPLFHESGAQKAGEIKRETAFPGSLKNAILSGPNIYVSNPLYKTPRRHCTRPQHYDSIDLTKTPVDYCPRTNFSTSGIIRPIRSDFSGKNHFTDRYRIVFRRRIDLQSERSFTAAIIPPGCMHIAGLHSAAFENEQDMLDMCALVSSLPYDFLYKALGKGDIGVSDFKAIPTIRLNDECRIRVLALNCLTKEYASLWDHFTSPDNHVPWSVQNSRLTEELNNSENWRLSSPLRTDFARRLALVEIDVLVALSLGWSLEQLIDVYRLSFPLLQLNEHATWYDQRGRIVWTGSRALSGVGWLDEQGKSPGRAAWEKILAENPSELNCKAIDDTMPGGPREVTRHFVGPFDTCDRIDDYKRAWAHFERLKSEEAA